MILLFYDCDDSSFYMRPFIFSKHTIDWIFSILSCHPHLCVQLPSLCLFSLAPNWTKCVFNICLTLQRGARSQTHSTHSQYRSLYANDFYQTGWVVVINCSIRFPHRNIVLCAISLFILAGLIFLSNIIIALFLHKSLNRMTGGFEWRVCTMPMGGLRTIANEIFVFF